MSLLDPPVLDPFPFKQRIALRSRGVQGSSTLNASAGIQLDSCGSAVIEGNTIDLDTYYRIFFASSSATPECFDNTTPAGAIIQAFNYETQKKVDELATNIEDTLCISI